MGETNQTEAAEYFGLTVEVICRIEDWALVRFGDREFALDAADLAIAGSDPSVHRQRPGQIPKRVALKKLITTKVVSAP